jgi:putative restriction endonuclease
MVFPEEVFRLFRTDQRLVRNMVQRLMNGHFPDSLHANLLADVGLADAILPEQSARAPAFRIAFPNAYQQRRAVCTFDVRLGGTDLALETAHVKWYQAGGRQGGEAWSAVMMNKGCVAKLL